MSAKRQEHTNGRALGFSEMVETDSTPEQWSAASAKTVALYVRSLLQNWRQGTVGCKGRSDVSFSNRKPWKQKGTGRARAGSARSPLWRGGGVIFGPEPRVRDLKISKKLKRSALRSVLYEFMHNDKLLELDWNPPTDRPKTSVAYAALKELGMHDKKITLFLSSTDAIVAGSFANIPSVRLVGFDEPNVYYLLDSSHLVVLKKDLNLFKEMVSKWS